MHYLNKGLAAAVIGVMGLGVAAQAQDVTAPPSDTAGTISVWTWPNNDRTIAALLPLFNEAYPNITVNVQGFPTANDGYLNNLQRAMLSGSGPDVAMIEIGMMALLRDRPHWADLRAEPFNAGSFIEGFAPFTQANVVRAEDGAIIALPKHTGPGGAFYRRDVFESAGLPTDPTEVSALLADWDAFIAEGQKLVIPNERWAVGSSEELVRALMAQNGLSNFDADGNLQFENPVVRQTLERVAEAAELGMISPFAAWTPEWQGAYQRGQIGITFFGNWFGGLLKRAYAADQSGEWAVAAAPGIDGNRSFNSGGDYIGILEGSQNKEAAWAFVTWLTTNDASLMQQYQQDDLYPAWTAAGSAEWMNFADPYYGGQNVNEVFGPIQAEVIPFVLNPLDPVANRALYGAANNVARGEMTVDQALEAAIAEVRARM